MILLHIYGLDQFVVGDASKELTKPIADLYEVEEDDVNFIATNNMVFHKGVEQTSWHILVEVEAPFGNEDAQDQLVELINNALGEVAINIEYIFKYYSIENHKLMLNEDYPRYLSEDNMVIFEEQNLEDLVEGEEDDEIYTGDIFANIPDLDK